MALPNARQDITFVFHPFAAVLGTVLLALLHPTAAGAAEPTTGEDETEQMFIEEGASDNCPTDPFAVSDADTLLAWIRGEAAPQEKPDQRAFIG